MSSDFKKSFYAKCILSGEHAVLRDSPAIVVPFKTYYMTLNYQKNVKTFSATTSGPHGESIKYLFWVLLELALDKLGKDKSDLKGAVDLNSHLPLGGGLGASAALSVAVGELLGHMGLIAQNELFDFCRDLEDHFHGESSGADIAIAFHKQAIRFMRPNDVTALDVKWRPQFYLLYTGESGVTAECVHRVKGLKEKQPDVFKNLDIQMKKSVSMCEQALSQNKTQEAFALLCQGLKLGHECFKQWDLITPEVAQSISYLETLGAKAYKLTGSGRGGFLLGLWQEEPSKEALKNLVPLEI